jgi:thioredoxin reductase (NADPH)
MAEPLDLVIVGGGVAGLHAALAAAEVGVISTVVEQLTPGGRVASLNELYGAPADGLQLGHELAASLFEAVLNAGVAVVFDAALSLEGSADGITLRTETAVLRSRIAIVATGCNIKPLGTAGDQAMYGHGLSTCAACDGPLYKGKDVVVVGGGDSGALEALELTKFARRVAVVFKEAEPHCEPMLLERVLASDRIELIPKATVVGLETSAGVLKGVNFELPGRSGRAPCDAVFCCAGLTPVSELVSAQFATDDEGYALTGNDGGIDSRLFAAGDVASKTAKSVRAAIESGRRCALAAVARLS